MSWFTDILSGGVDKIVDSVGAAIDRNVTTDHERLKIQNELEKIKLDAAQQALKLEAELELKMEESVTSRWQADMSSDEPIAKKVRPYSLVYLLVVVSILSVIDGNLLSFTVKDVYIELFQALLMLVFGAYYGGRTIEKVMKRK
jgi:hypothetical protein